MMMVQSPAPGADKSVDQLVTEELMDGEEAVAEPKSSVAAKPVPPKPRGGLVTPAPLPPPANTTPKRPVDDEDAEPCVAVKYWVTLGCWEADGLGSCLVLALWAPFTRQPGQESVVCRKPGGQDYRGRGTLSIERSPMSLPLLRGSLAKDSKEREPEVVVRAMSGLSVALDWESFSFFVAAMNHESPAVRTVAYQGVLKFLGLPADQEETIAFRATDPSDKRSEAVRRLQQILDKRKTGKMPPDPF